MRHEGWCASADGGSRAVSNRRSCRAGLPQRPAHPFLRIILYRFAFALAEDIKRGALTSVGVLNLSGFHAPVKR